MVISFEEALEKSGTPLTEAKQLCSGIFWILSDYHDLSDYKLLILIYRLLCEVGFVNFQTIIFIIYIESMFFKIW